jgi:signal transduction histidine kinase
MSCHRDPRRTACGRANELRIPRLSVYAEGAPRDLHPILRDEVCRIASEVLRNAFRHAQARRIKAEIRYDEDRLQGQIRDDGRGTNEQVLTDRGSKGQRGLARHARKGQTCGR